MSEYIFLVLSVWVDEGWSFWKSMWLLTFLFLPSLSLTFICHSFQFFSSDASQNFCPCQCLVGEGMPEDFQLQKIASCQLLSFPSQLFHHNTRFRTARHAWSDNTSSPRGSLHPYHTSFGHLAAFGRIQLLDDDSPLQSSDTDSAQSLDNISPRLVGHNFFETTSTLLSIDTHALHAHEEIDLDIRLILSDISMTQAPTALHELDSSPFWASFWLPCRSSSPGQDLLQRQRSQAYDSSQSNSDRDSTVFPFATKSFNTFSSPARK